MIMMMKQQYHIVKVYIKKGEKFIEYPEDIQDDNYNLDNRYFVLKDKISKLENSQEVLEDFYKQFFMAALIDDRDKGTGYIVDKNNKISFASYYDLGTVFAYPNEYGYRDFFSDSLLIEQDIETYCNECDYTREEVMEQFNNQLKYYMSYLKDCFENLNNESIIMDCLPNIPVELMDNIINFDIVKTLQNDNHIYSENSKKAIIGMMNVVLETFKPQLENLKKIKLNNKHSNIR